MEAEIVADYGDHVGEGPLWNTFDSRLYWVDIPRGRIYRFDPESGRSERFFEGSPSAGSPFRRMARCCCSWTADPSAS